MTTPGFGASYAPLHGCVDERGTLALATWSGDKVRRLAARFRRALTPTPCVMVLTRELSAQSCTYGQWTAATRAAPSDFPLRNVERIDVDGRLGLAANLIARFDSLPLQLPAAEFRDTDGALMPLPRGGTRFAFPKVVNLGRANC